MIDSLKVPICFLKVPILFFNDNAAIYENQEQTFMAIGAFTLIGNLSAWTILVLLHHVMEQKH